MTIDCNAGKKGLDGPIGMVPLAVAGSGVAGAEGWIRAVSTAQYKVLPAALPLGWFANAIHDIELRMVNSEYALARQEADWLSFVTLAAKEQSKLGDADRVGARLLAISELLDSGIDVFGRNFNYVPLTSFDTISGLVRQQIQYLEPAEKALRDLQSANASQGKKREALLDASRQLSTFLATAEQERTQLSSRAGTLQDEVRSLFETLLVLHARLIKAEKSFKDAVKEKNGCATFENVLKVGALVATVISTGGAIAPMVGSFIGAAQGLSAWQSLSAGNLTWSNIKEDANRIATITKEARGSAADFAKAANELQKAYKEAFPERPEIPEVLDQAEDSAKLIARKDEFDKQIEPYLKLPEARKYKALMHQYISTAETRNNKILEHDRTCVEIMQWGARASFQRKALELLSATEAEQFDARLPENVAFLELSVNDLKWQVIRQLVSMEKSLEYMTGVPGNAKYADFSVAALQVTAASILSRYAQVLESFGQESQFGTRFAVPLRELMTEQDMADFVAGKAVVITLPEQEDDLFASLYSVQTGRFGFADGTGKTLPGRMNISINHLGRSVVRRETGEHTVFTHVPVRASYIQNLYGEVASQGDLLDSVGESKRRYAGVSPYGPWMIKLNSASDDARQALGDAVAVFSAFFRTMPISAAGPQHAVRFADGRITRGGLLDPQAA